jgi:small-conductance mechanosensitive channel
MKWLNQMDNFKTFTLVLANKNFVTTSLFIFIFYMVKHLIVKIIKKSTPDKRLQINIVNNIFTILMIVMVFNIWAEELQNFAFSIAAFIVAIVLATREFIQCFIGFFYLLSSRPFRIGDWGQVGNNYGEVHSTDWAKLTPLKISIDDYQYKVKRYIYQIAS